MFFFWILFLSILRLPASQGWTIITAEPGQNVSLPCRAGRDGGIIAVVWSRSGLGSDYVFLFRNNGPDAEAQHESYQNRVDLQDRQMKDGDVSLLLKNVTINDTGTYECEVVQGGGTEYRTTVHLEVPPPERIIRVTAGHDVILPCQAPSNYRRPYDAVLWSRGGKETGHVFLFRHGKPVPDYQHPSYQNRADLQDRQMKDGDVSLVLKDVTTDDTGIYGCRVRQRRGTRRKRDVDPPIISTVHLEVSPSGGAEDGEYQQQGDQDGEDKDEQTQGRHGLAVGLPAAGIIMMAAPVAAGVWIYKKKILAPPQSDSGGKDPMSSSDQQPDV